MGRRENQKKKSRGAVEKVQYVTITIREYKKKKIVVQKEKTDKNGIVEVRVQTKKTSWSDPEDVKYKWETIEYRIPLFRLNLTKDATKAEILEVLNNPSRVANSGVSEVLKKLVTQYNGIKGGGKGKYEFKTERFRKRRDFGPKKKVIIG